MILWAHFFADQQKCWEQGVRKIRQVGANPFEKSSKKPSTRMSSLKHIKCFLAEVDDISTILVSIVLGDLCGGLFRGRQWRRSRTRYVETICQGKSCSGQGVTRCSRAKLPAQSKIIPFLGGCRC